MVNELDCDAFVIREIGELEGKDFSGVILEGSPESIRAAASFFGEKVIVRALSSIAERAEGEAVAWRWREHYNAARDDRWHLEKELPQFSYEVEIQPLFTHPSPSQVAPADPAQGVIRQIVEDALNSPIPEPWEVAEHATQRILAAIGAGSTARVTDTDLTARLKEIAVEVFPSANKFAVADGVKSIIRILERIKPAEYAVLHRSMYPFSYSAPTEDDGQPDEAQEWHDYDPDC